MHEPFLKDEPNEQEMKIEVIIEDEYIPKGHKINPALENNDFKGNFFIQFLVYFVLEVLLGPFAWFIYRFILPNGVITAGNIKILKPSGCYPITRLLIYIIRCYVIFVTFWMGKTWIEFYLLCFTETSLIILFSGYYSTFRHSEIIRFKTIKNSNKNEHDMANIFKNLIEKNKLRFLQRDKLKEEFPEIDFNMFYFYFKMGKQPRINVELKGSLDSLVKENTAIEMMEKYNDTIIIDGVILTNYIARLCDDEKAFATKAKISKILSRIIVIIKLCAPFVADLITLDVTFDHFSDLNYICYSSSLVFLAILIYRSCIIYDTIFLGLISYLYKLKLLNFLHNLLKEKDFNPNLFYIDMLIPENITNWYNMRKILTRLNQQFFSLVDVILSYLLLYIFITCVYILLTVFFGIQLALVDDFLGDKTFKIITDSYKVVIVVVLYYGLKIGYQINQYFDFNKAILTKNKDTIHNMASFDEYYLDSITFAKNSTDNNDKQTRYLINILDLLNLPEKSYNKEEMGEKFRMHLEKLTKQLQIIIDQIQFEAEMYPHKLLGLHTNEDFIWKLISIVSIISASNVKEFM